MTLEEAQRYLKDQLNALRALYPSQTPYVFLCAASHIEYLMKIVNGRDAKSKGYKQFIRTWLSRIRPGYASFTFPAGKADLPEQMYHRTICAALSWLLSEATHFRQPHW